MDGVFPGTWESNVPKYVQLSDCMVGNALLCQIAPAKLVEWYPCDFAMLPGKVFGLRPGRTSSGQSLRRIHQAFGVDLAGDAVHNVDVAVAGIVGLGHVSTQYAITPLNVGYTKVMKSPSPIPNSKILLTRDKYYAVKSAIGAGDEETEDTSSGGSAKKRRQEVIPTLRSS